jgi:uncharacterized cupredoxin-like copper-binding protein
MAAPGAAGHGHGHAHAPPAVVGEPAPRGQGRPVPIVMTDFAYSLKTVSVRAGETIRFIITNKGAVLHEFNINTEAEHVAHRPMMAMMMDHGMITAEKVISLTMTMPDGSKMSHIEPNSVLVEPGKSAELSWKFTTAGELQIGCNIPGHTEGGMVSTITVRPR